MRSIVFRSTDEMIAGAADAFARRTIDAFSTRGSCVIALSGGMTPRPLYRLLADPDRPWSQQIPWSGIHVIWSDERCVPPNHEHSNYFTAYQTLLRHVPIPPANIHRMRGESPPTEACREYEERLRSLAALRGDPAHLRVDLVLLGVGRDGHTASLFPNHPALAESKLWVSAVNVQAEPPQRLTLTLPLLNHARHVLFLVAGREKRDLVTKLRRGDELPATQVTPHDGEVTWYFDNEATSA